MEKWKFIKSPKFWITLLISIIFAGSFYFYFIKNENITIIGEQVIQKGPGTGKTCIASEPGSVGCSTTVRI